MASCAAPYRFPLGFASSTNRLISAVSFSVNSMSRLAQFCSKRPGFVVPGMAIMPCEATHASAICGNVQPLARASFWNSSTMALFL